MTKRTTRQRAPDDPDGPPDIQRDPVEAADGTVLRSARVEETEWTDPDDKQALERGPDGRRRAKKVRGFRTVDPVLHLHRVSPEECPLRFVRAANCLRDDYEVAHGANVPRNKIGSGELSPEDVRVAAMGKVRAAFNAVGPTLWGIIMPVVVHGWSVTRLATARSVSTHRMTGSVTTALARLADHYVPEKERATIMPAALVPDDGLPPERLGRWREHA